MGNNVQPFRRSNLTAGKQEGGKSGFGKEEGKEKRMDWGRNETNSSSKVDDGKKGQFVANYGPIEEG